MVLRSVPRPSCLFVRSRTHKCVERAALGVRHRTRKCGGRASTNFRSRRVIRGIRPKKVCRDGVNFNGYKIGGNKKYYEDIAVI